MHDEQAARRQTLLKRRPVIEEALSELTSATAATDAAADILTTQIERANARSI